MASIASAAIDSSSFQNSKRNRSGSEESLEELSKRPRPENTTSKWYRFYVISAANKAIGIKANPFAINTTIKSMVGTVKSVKRLRSGDVLVEVASSHQAVLIEKLTEILDSPVTVQPHRTLNFSKSIIHCPEIKDVSKEEIVEQMRDQGVCEARKFGNKGTVCLTFASSSPPNYVNIGYLRCKCSTFVPNPLRCYQCQKFGHGSNDCKGSPTCSKCGQAGHNKDDCPNDVCCANCSGPHEAVSKQCPTWIKEKGILKIKTTQNISYPEARRMYSQPPPTVASFSHVASSQPKKPDTAEMAIQTDDTLALTLIKDLIKTPAFRSAVLEIVASVVPNVSEPMHVSVENDVSTNVNVCKSADCSSSHEADAVAAKSVPAHDQTNNKSGSAQVPLSRHNMAVTAADSVRKPANTQSVTSSRKMVTAVQKARQNNPRHPAFKKGQNNS